jgi:hypothetical protein
VVALCGLTGDRCRDEFQAARLVFEDDRLVVLASGGRVNVSTGPEERGGNGDAGGQDYRRLSPDLSPSLR